jgi:hypothetical protein
MVESLATNLAQKIQTHVPSGTDTPRMKTAQSSQALLASLTNADPGAVYSCGGAESQHPLLHGFRNL